MLIVPYLSSLPEKPEACFLHLFAEGLNLDVAHAPWSNHGTRATSAGEHLPKVKAALAHTDKALLVAFQVRTDGLLLQYDRDQDPVWQDSCVEIFLSPGGEPEGYYNFEFNARGACLSAFGTSRHSRSEMSAANLAKIERWSSAQSLSNGFQPGIIDWQLLLRIPVDCLVHHTIPGWGNRELRCNLQACGDHLPHPYYLVWAPIATAKPDFHRPEFFQPLICAASGSENGS